MYINTLTFMGKHVLSSDQSCVFPTHFLKHLTWLDCMQYWCLPWLDSFDRFGPTSESTLCIFKIIFYCNEVEFYLRIDTHG